MKQRPCVCGHPADALVDTPYGLADYCEHGYPRSEVEAIIQRHADRHAVEGTSVVVRFPPEAPFALVEAFFDRTCHYAGMNRDGWDADVWAVRGEVESVAINDPDADLAAWTHHEECDWSAVGVVVPCLGEPDCRPSGTDQETDGFDACPEPTCPLYGKAVMADHRHLDTPAARRRKTGGSTPEPIKPAAENDQEQAR